MSSPLAAQGDDVSYPMTLVSLCSKSSDIICISLSPQIGSEKLQLLVLILIDFGVFDIDSDPLGVASTLLGVKPTLKPHPAITLTYLSALQGPPLPGAGITSPNK